VTERSDLGVVVDVAVMDQVFVVDCKGHIACDAWQAAFKSLWGDWWFAFDHQDLLAKWKSQPSPVGFFRLKAEATLLFFQRRLAT